jgi:hypothetical protein
VKLQYKGHVILRERVDQFRAYFQALKCVGTFTTAREAADALDEEQRKLDRKRSASLRRHSTEKLNHYQREQVCLLAGVHPYPIRIVEYVFVMCGKSFDKTEKALELGAAYNSIERGIDEANI